MSVAGGEPVCWFAAAKNPINPLLTGQLRVSAWVMGLMLLTGHLLMTSRVPDREPLVVTVASAAIEESAATGGSVATGASVAAEASIATAALKATEASSVLMRPAVSESTRLIRRFQPPSIAAIRIRLAFQGVQIHRCCRSFSEYRLESFHRRSEPNRRSTRTVIHWDDC